MSTSFTSQRVDQHIERLAVILHESGRESVEKRLLFRNDLPVKPFCEWRDLPEEAREGRRSQARYLSDRVGEVSWLLTQLNQELD